MKILFWSMIHKMHLQTINKNQNSIAKLLPKFYNNHKRKSTRIKIISLVNSKRISCFRINQRILRSIQWVIIHLINHQTSLIRKSIMSVSYLMECLTLKNIVNNQIILHKLLKIQMKMINKISVMLLIHWNPKRKYLNSIWILMLKNC